MPPHESSPLTREECLALLAEIVHDQEISLKDRVDALRVHSAIWGLKLSERDRWRVFSALVNSVDLIDADEVPAPRAVEAVTGTAK